MTSGRDEGRDQDDRRETSVFSAGGAARLAREERDEAQRVREAAARRRGRSKKEKIERADREIADTVAAGERALSEAVRADLAQAQDEPDPAVRRSRPGASPRR